MNPLDAAISWLDPERGLKRVRARAAIQVTRRAYEGAKVGRRTDGWHTTNKSGNAEIATDLVRLRDRSRDLVRNYPYAAQALDNLECDIIGTGILARAKSAKAAALWKAWSKVSDAEGLLGFEAQQGLSVRGMVEGGEMLIRRRWRRPADGLPVPLQLQLMEGDFLDHNKTGIFDGALVIQGVEFNAIGGRAAYWLFDRHPGDVSAGLGRASISLTSNRIPASEIIHLYRAPRIGQVRGVPWFHAAIRVARDLDEYEDAELMRKKIESCLAVFVTGSDTGEPITGDTKTDAAGKRIEHVEPGMINYLKTGEGIETAQPAQSGDYGSYATTQLRKSAAGMRNTYEDMTGDLSNVNYSSYRAGHIRHWRMIDVVRWQTVVPLLCDRVWGWFVEAAIVAGKLSDTDSAVPVTWTPPRRESVDPGKDAVAQIKNIRAGLQGWEDAVSENGYDPDEQLAQIASVNQKLDAAGIVLDIDPRKVTMTGSGANVSGKETGKGASDGNEEQD